MGVERVPVVGLGLGKPLKEIGRSFVNSDRDRSRDLTRDAEE
jgi:hypothetical protein